MSDTAMMPRKPGDGSPARRPLVDPQRLALVGASPKEGTVGKDGNPDAKRISETTDAFKRALHIKVASN